MVAIVRSPVFDLVHQCPHEVDAKSADRSIAQVGVEVRRGNVERVEGAPAIGHSTGQRSVAEFERDVDLLRPVRFEGVRNNVRQNLIEDQVEVMGHLGRDAVCFTESFDRRSEEHTSELQSLMRISYAVFCLKKTTKNKNN